MRRFFALTIIVAAALATVLLASRPSVTTAGSLVLAAPMLQPRSGHSATLLPDDGRVLIAGGMRRNQDFWRSAELYDPASGKFLPTGSMSLARVGHLAVLLPSGKVLIAGGWVMGGGTTDLSSLADGPGLRRRASHAPVTWTCGIGHILMMKGDVRSARSRRVFVL